VYGVYVVVVGRHAAGTTGTTGLHAPPGPGSASVPLSRRDVTNALRSLLPPLAIIAATVGAVLGGVATPTESGGFGATAALALARVRGRLDTATLRSAVDATTLICCALFIMMGATFFTLPFNAIGGKEWMGQLFAQLPGGETGFLVAAVLLIFVLAFFLDFFEIAFLALPLLMPVVATLGIEPAWFAVLVCIALQTSFMHPPFGVAIYTLRSVAPPTLASRDLYWGALPFMGFQLAVALVVIAFPGLAFDFGRSAPPVLSPQEVERVLRAMP
jgi:TRAP-type mannitol/chloroaromatic compound transport system permease large subunit